MVPPTRSGSAPRIRGGQTIPVATASISGRGGRPARAQAEKIRERIIDAATHLFLTLGYGATSIEAVAQRTRISKRTFYHRFDDKPALFAAVVHSIIDRLRPPADVPLIDGGNLQDVLHRLAGLILRAALAQQAIALHRLIVGESARFPHLTAVVAGQGTSEALQLIAGVPSIVKREPEIFDSTIQPSRQSSFCIWWSMFHNAGQWGWCTDDGRRTRHMGEQRRQSVLERLPRLGACVEVTTTTT